MYSPIQLALKYFHYYFRASNGKGHGIHSPFVFDFIRNVLADRKSYSDYYSVESRRRVLRNDKTVLFIQDFGAGSSTGKNDRRTVASIAKRAVKGKKYGQLLYRMVKYYQPRRVLELGTSLGITTAYMAKAAPLANITTIEGAPAIATVAVQGFEKLKIQNVDVIEGNFDLVLPNILFQKPNFDLVFVDGNHKKGPTQKYFQALLPFFHKDSMVVFDDIHWSQEMEEAWQAIQKHESVMCSIDIFFMGIIFFKQEFVEKQHFMIRF